MTLATRSVQEVAQTLANLYLPTEMGLAYLVSAVLPPSASFALLSRSVRHCSSPIGSLDGSAMMDTRRFFYLELGASNSADITNDERMHSIVQAIVGALAWGNPHS